MKLLLRVLLKGLLLYVLLDLLVGLVALPHLGRISAYNHLFPGRERLPFGESPTEAYNFSLFDLDAMLAAHRAAAPKPAGEYRIILIGDSSVWGTLLRPEQTLAGQLNMLAAARGLAAPDGRRVHFYNLGYPTLSLTKDLLVLGQARALQPDMLVWLVTLEAFPRDSQLTAPLVANNPDRARAVIARYHLDLPSGSLRSPDFWQRTLIGRRKDLADLIRLQLYGFLWAATGVDQTYPTDYPRAQTDLAADPKFHGKEDLSAQDLTLEALANAQADLGKIPLLVVNEPILVSAGKNSAIRYNFYYPRKAYDAYRQILAGAAAQGGYHYLDAWDLVSADHFTNSAIHIDAAGTGLLAAQVRQSVAEMLAGK